MLFYARAIHWRDKEITDQVKSNSQDVYYLIGCFGMNIQEFSVHSVNWIYKMRYFFEYSMGELQDIAYVLHLKEISNFTCD